MGRLITALTVLLAGANVLAGDEQSDKEMKGGNPPTSEDGNDAGRYRA